jgi:hypothetical protein
MSRYAERQHRRRHFPSMVHLHVFEPGLGQIPSVAAFPVPRFEHTRYLSDNVAHNVLGIASGQYPNKWSVHDMGSSYPVANGARALPALVFLSTHLGSQDTTTATTRPCRLKVQCQRRSNGIALTANPRRERQYGDHDPELHAEDERQFAHQHLRE